MIPGMDVLVTSPLDSGEEVMKRPATPVLPVEETVKHKTDNLDWESLGAQTCELEFRPPMVISLAGATFARAPCCSGPRSWLLP